MKMHAITTVSGRNIGGLMPNLTPLPQNAEMWQTTLPIARQRFMHANSAIRRTHGFQSDFISFG